MITAGRSRMVACMRLRLRHPAPDRAACCSAAETSECAGVRTGQERRLIYPSREADARGGSDAATTSFEEGWDPERWGEATMACDFQDTEAMAALAAPPAALPAPLAPRDTGSLPSSPGELLRYLASDEHKAEQRAFQRLVACSYEVRFKSAPVTYKARLLSWWLVGAFSCVVEA